MPDFPHLPLVQTITGVHKPPRRRFDKETDARTTNNLNNRAQHGQNLIQVANDLRDARNIISAERRNQGLPDLPGEESIPVFLQVDTSLFSIESLKGLGIEIISEEEDGFIIGASTDGFSSLHSKIEKFINEEGKFRNQAAQLWQIVAGNQWRPQQILSEELLRRWIGGIPDDEQFIVDISVACYLRKPDQPIKEEGESDERYATRLSRWEQKVQEIDNQRFDLSLERENAIETFIRDYNGQIIGGYVEFEDSFCFRAQLSGLALKDFILNYPYVFEIVEFEETDQVHDIDAGSIEDDFELIQPLENAPRICVIDSGIQENHRLLATSLLPGRSLNFDPTDITTADLVANGGHGTKVAGAILFGDQIPTAGVHNLHCFILNARILDRNCRLSSSLYPAKLMEEIVDLFNDAKIFNLSVNSAVPCRLIHMSTWAANIDRLSHENQILFIVSAGNINTATHDVHNPGIIEHLNAGRSYPDYLLERASRIADPAQSKFAITVGSVCLDSFEDLDRISFGRRDQLSSFSRTGLGLWGGIKPDVVEYGGDWVKEKLGVNLSNEENLNPLLVRSGGHGVGRSSIGTSFSTPKVTHIASKLQAQFPNESPLLYKALIIQSARLPQQVFRNPTVSSLKMFGYGIPNLERATQNTERRVTLVDSSSVKARQANLYTVNIPDELRRPGEDFDILIEVTLCYTAKPRRTRRRTQSYLSSWLSWESSKSNESFDGFKARVLKHIENPDDEMLEDQDSIRWSIWSSPTWGLIKGVKRQDSPTQKDWVIIKSNSLPEHISFAVIGHKGWEQDLFEKIPFSLAVSFEVLEGELEIYERIRASNQVEIEQEVQAVI